VICVEVRLGDQKKRRERTDEDAQNILDPVYVSVLLYYTFSSNNK
jgi:hypothetical protein